MSGLYIHIPFCKSRCIYCGFYSTTEREFVPRYVEALCEELRLRSSEEAASAGLDTIYMGGGTPSQLQMKHIDAILDTIYKYYKVKDCAEITMECNPDDVTEESSQWIKDTAVNRVSMGAQTFHASLLHFIRRRHTPEQVEDAVERLRRAGIGNISVDLMFGFPGESLAQWREDIDSALRLGVEHLSAYSLMYEEGTALYRMLEQGYVEECADEVYEEMYYILIDRLADSGYEHYEISNFARSGFRSRHNSSYWQGVPYIGVGAAAHSYDGNTRQWNVSDIRRYAESLERGQVPAEVEVLTADMKYDDAVMTRLRTKEGLGLDYVALAFGSEYRNFLMQEAERHLRDGLLRLDETTKSLVLTRKGLMLSDTVMSDLMRV